METQNQDAKYTQYIDTKTLSQDQQQYFSQNPQVLTQLNQFIYNVQQRKPTDFNYFGQRYFNLQKYTPIVITGASGAGKGTIINFLLNEFPGKFELSVSLTTRKPRPGEVDGIHYYFVDIQEAEKVVEQNLFAEFCYVHGNYYGTHIGKLMDIANRQKIPLLDIDVQGGEKIHAQYPHWNYIFLGVPSEEEQEKRLRGRGTETEEQIQKRLTNAKKEVARLKELEYYREIVNDKFEDTKQKFVSYLKEKYEKIFD